MSLFSSLQRRATEFVHTVVNIDGPAKRRRSTRTRIRVNRETPARLREDE